MNSTEPEADGSRGAFSLDSTVPGAAASGFDAFTRGWEAQVGGEFPLPAFSRATTGDFRVKGRAVRVRDVAVTDVRGTSVIRTEGPLDGAEDQIRLFVVRRGAWTLGGGPDGGERAVSAGQFLLRHVGRPSHFETAPHTAAKIVVLPPTTLKPLLGNRVLTGPADSAEVRLLAAHTNMIHTTMTGLGPAGVRAAHSILLELTKAVAMRRFDDAEPRLVPALVQAAKDLADRRLADSELSPLMLARELAVSVRTLQRAFAAVGEPVTAYIRRRRLEEARLALIAPGNRWSVAELAAYWQFADSSHFIRAFKRHYGRTPAEYTRSAG